VRPILQWKFIVASACMKKKSERSKINNLMMNLKVLEKQEQVNTQISRQKEIIKLRAEIN
jgi:hypothetical protein